MRFPYVYIITQGRGKVKFWGEALQVEKFVSWIFVSRDGSFENENHSHLPKPRGGGLPSVILSSPERLSAARLSRGNIKTPPRKSSRTEALRASRVFIVF